MISSLRNKSAWLKLAAIAMVIGSLVAPMGSALAESQPRDNDANAIMYGGCYSKQECNNKIANGDTKHSAANLQQIYFNENRGMTRDNFQHTVDGVVYKNGDVRVNGQLVATGARAIGRTNMPGSTKVGSVYERPTSVSFAADSIPAYINMDGGTFHYFVIKSCGNWGHATPVKKPTPSPTATKKPTPSATPAQSFKCVELTPTKLSSATDKVNFRFTLKPDAKNVTITGYRFTFSDTNQTVDTIANTPFIDHAFGAGTYTVKGQVKTSAGITAVSEACSATVTVNKNTPSSTPTPHTPTPTSTPQVLGAATLPATGPETALGGMAGLTAVGFASRAYLRSRKGLVDAMRNKNRK
jgi:hypothetical protein